MNKADFISNYLEHSKAEGFSFLYPSKQFDSPNPMSSGKQAMMAAAAAAAWAVVFGGGGAVVGAIAGANVGYEDHSKDEIVADLQSMNLYCDLVGMGLAHGICSLQLVLDGDEISHETLVGRFVMIHERLHTFRKYSMVVMKNWIWGDRTAGTQAQVVVYFSSHKKAKDFTVNYAEKCKHREFRKQVITLPLVVDLEDEEVAMFHFGLFKFNQEKYKAVVFRKRN